MTPNEDQLLCRYLDGRLREEEKEALQDVLRNSAAARKRLRMLATVTEGISGRGEIAPKVVPVSRNNSLIPWTIAAAATIMAFVGWMVRSPHGPESPDASDSFLALLVDEVGAEFSDGNAPDGIRFQPGNHELEQGMIHLRFANGADVVMKAPASFEINDGFHMGLHYGVIWAMAPPSAQGFTVATPGVDFEDIGTEFALSVDRDTGASQLHVIDGQVDARQPQSKKLISSVTEGQSLQFTDGTPKPADAQDLEAYLTPEDIGLLRWEQQRADFGKDDPDLIGYYPFIESGSLRNEAVHPVAGDGEIHGARWVSGRWSGKRALLFDRDTDFVELDVPGQYREMSFSAWVMLDRLDHSFNAIFHSNGWEMGDVHWSVLRPGTMTIGFRGARHPGRSKLAKDIPTDQWIHIAGTLSQESGKSCVYLNGELAGTGQTDTEANFIRPGLGRIGNWLMGDRVHRGPLRALRGKMDEMAIWKRALTEEEIKELVEKGKPSALWSVASK